MELSVEMLLEMAYALGIGLLIGLERSLGVALTRRSSRAAICGADGETDDGAEIPDDDGDFLGLRTFAVLSLVGYVGALAGERLPWVAPVILAGISLLVMDLFCHQEESATVPAI